MNRERIYYYKSFQDDVVEAKKQDYKLKDNYKWIKNSFFYNIFASVVYCIVKIFGMVYCKFYLHIKFENKKILKKYKKQGYFLYGNHTQPIGDVVIPAILNGRKRIYTIASTSNLGIPFIGKLLPMLGILPIPNSIGKMKFLVKAVNKRIEEKKCIVIYPEAHVWPYYTKIRPFVSNAFKYQIDTNSISFCFTTTYQKKRFGKKPKITIYIDGPFIPDKQLDKKQRQEKLMEQVINTMQDKSQNSTYEFIKYKEKKI